MKLFNKTSLIFVFLSVIALAAFAKKEKVIQVFKNGEVIQEFAVSDIDYIEVNERVADTDNVPDNEIWYITRDNSIIDYLGKDIYTAYDEIGLNGKPFDVNIIDHYFDGEKCIIKCDGPITKINNRCFSIDDPDKSKITAIFLPNSIVELGRYCFSMADITEFRIPDNLRICTSPFISNPRLTRFSGKHTDGRSIIINNTLYQYAPGAKDENYEIPYGVTEIGIGAFDTSKLKTVNIPESVKRINYSAFERSSLVSVTIPESVEYIGHNAFDLCLDLQGYYGNSNFVTDDNMCFITPDPSVSGGKQLNAFAGHNLKTYEIPEGITSVRTMSFYYGGENLLSVTLPSTIVNVAAMAFKDLPNLQYIYGPGTIEGNKGYVRNGELQLFLGKGITSYTVPKEVTALGDYLFEYNNYIENITLHDGVKQLGMDCFANCENLKSITLSSNISVFPFYCFKRSYNLTKLVFRSLVPPQMIDATCPGGFFPEKEYENLTIYVPEQSKEQYLNASGWEQFAKYIKGYDIADLSEYDYYTSTDYSQDGTVTTLRQASVGNGIDIVLMGDGFSDRQISDGSYMKAMQSIADNLFTEEPYKSFKEMFNVYVVNVVSFTESYEHGNTALGGFFGEGTLVGGNDRACFQYAKKAISEDKMDDALVIVAMNKDAYAGTCYMYNPEKMMGDYGRGASISYFLVCSDLETLSGLIHHEALGHGFAKLADEYAYEYMGNIPNNQISESKEKQATLGWLKNVDFTSDISAIRWNKFISDGRFDNEEIGAYPGGLTYWSGVWRPTENSIMRYNSGGFNAPSREAIYYRINKLAYGDSWVYNYEDFVSYDSINRNKKNYERMKKSPVDKRENLHAPVMVNRNWREAGTLTNTLTGR